MTIKPGSSWGVEIPRPPHVHVASDDRELARALAAAAGGGDERTWIAAGGGDERIWIAAGGGDLARTLGSPQLAGRTRVVAYPIDLVEVRLDGVTDPIPACAHVVARTPTLTGGWLRGPALAVMNAEFLGPWDVAPRGHPGDGRVETFEIGDGFGLRQRWQARRRLPLGTHVPHPRIRTRSVRTASWEFDVAREIRVDGERIGTARALEVVVRPDAATVLA